MKVYDLETDSLHDLTQINYKENYVVMYSPEYGFTRNTLDKVSFPIEDENKVLREALEYLVKTKDRKDTIGKDSVYLQMQKIAWRKARQALKNTEHETN